MAWRGLISRSLLAASRSSPRVATAVPRLGSFTAAAGPRLQRRRPSFSFPQSVGELGCAQSFLPLYSVVATPRLTSHLSVTARACCELSQEILDDARKLQWRFDREEWKSWFIKDAGHHSLGRVSKLK